MGSLDELREIQRALRAGPATYDQIAEATGLHVASVKRAIKALIESGCELVVGQDESSGGRPATTYKLTDRALLAWSRPRKR